ncbi:nitroreductase family protein|nr:nitroreductase family protein [archaeon]
MMEALKAINTRRSVRKYKKKKVPKKIIKELINAARNAPSSYNEQPWVFITITDKEKLRKIAEPEEQKSNFLKDAPLVIACCYDEKKSSTKIHNLENVAVAAENILIAANALGLGACYVTAFTSKYPVIEKRIRKVLKLPGNVHPVCLITIGYPDEEPVDKEMRPLKEVWKKEEYV